MMLVHGYLLDGRSWEKQETALLTARYRVRDLASRGIASSSEGVSMASSLSIDVFNSGYKPIPGGPGWDDSTPATWPASTSTLISGDRDAVLVDALLTTSEGERLAAWVQDTGKRPHAIFVTHGHGDHFFGAGPVLDAFPGAQLMACDQQVLDEARGQTTPEVMAIRIPTRPTTARPACSTSRAATSRTSTRRWPSPARRLR